MNNNIRFKVKNISILFCILVSSLSVVSAEGLKKFNSTISIQSDKDEYLIFEPIFIEYTFINNDLDDAPKIPSPFYLHLNFRIQNIDNNEGYGAKLIPEYDYENIKPIDKKQLHERIILNMLYGENNTRTRIPNYFPEGEYEIKCKWSQFGYEPIISNILNIKVVHPPKEEESVFQILQKLYNTKVHDLDGFEPFYEQLKLLTDNYKNSMYREWVLFCKIQASHPHSTFSILQAKNAGETLLNDYPKSFYGAIGVRAISEYYLKTNQLSAGIDILNKIRANSNNDKVIKEVQLQVYKLESKLGSNE